MFMNTPTSLKLGKYKHYKGGEYRVIGIAKREGTLEDMVIYETLYENPIAKTFVRPLAEFIEQVKTDTYSGQRFTYIGE